MIKKRTSSNPLIYLSNFQILISLIFVTAIIITAIVSLKTNPAFANDNNILPQSVSETKKILEQTALIEKTLEMETKEIIALSEYLEDIKSKKTEFDSTVNVYKMELTTFGSQLHLPDVEIKIIEKAYMSSQTAINRITQDISTLREKSEQLKQTQQSSYDQKASNDKFLMELKGNVNHMAIIEQSASSAQTSNSNQSSNSGKQSAVNQITQQKQNSNPKTTKSLSPDQQPALGKNADTKQMTAQEQKTAEEQKISQEQKTAEMQKAEEELKAAETQKAEEELKAAEKQKAEEEQKAAEKQKAEEEQKIAVAQLHNRLKYLQTALTKKILLMQSIYAIINERLPLLEDIQKKYKTLVTDLELRIRDAKKAELLTRKTNPLTQNTWKSVGDDIREFAAIAASILDKEDWINSFSFLWLSGLHKLLSFIFVLLILSIIAIRLKIFIKKMCESSSHIEKRYWSKIVLEIFGKNLLLSAITAFFYLCIKFKLFFSYSIIANLVVEILLFLVFILWMIHFLEQLQKKYPATPLKELILFHKALNLVAIIYILLGSALKSDNSIIIAYRLVCEILFYGWLIHFLKKIMPEIKSYCEKQSTSTKFQMICYKNKIAPTFYKNGALMIAIAGIILELLGYGKLAFYWYTSWGKTMVVLMWSGLIIGASGEWIPGGIHSAQQPDSTHGHVHAKNTFSMLWLIKQISFITLFFLVSIALMLSWASSDFIVPGLYTIVTYKFIVGSMSFSISSIAQAVMLLLITHFIAKSWQHFFQKNFLGESGLDQGLQESMTTITVYSIWIFGIFIALISFGLNTTTLTVAFGALSIGLGFGLQNIFSNFISGIILLFERPIQVGDDIEVNGTWATVRKTNVRSTVVQTYDNATIIIPNSELISNRVINWSFKDKRLRRKISVGVEYGADIELVRTTLLEIAGRTPKVLKYPEADVLFEDFGDSALKFSLRFWTFTDYFMTVETDVRFRINKVFKEKGIVIAFPQQDIHIKSLPKDFMASPKETTL
ncbi:MAG: mechanosensitive ion channel [Desulfamplus sp.]|nr:mechanosensitive ion channel [Desulfamplus sp.]